MRKISFLKIKKHDYILSLHSPCISSMRLCHGRYTGRTDKSLTLS